MIGLEIDLGKAVKKAKQKNARLIAVQLPEGLKQRAMEIVKELEEKTKAEVVVFADPCFGACDIADERAKELGADLLVHIGHEKMIEDKGKVPVVYLPLEYEFDARDISGRIAGKLKESGIAKIGLCATAQYAGKLDKIKNLLEEKGIRAETGEGNKGIVVKGQVLGCNFSAVKAVEKKVDAFVFVGDGSFHAIGISLAVKKPVFVANPLERDVAELREQRDLFLKRRFAAIALAKDADSFGILVSTKSGQMRIDEAVAIKKHLEEKGKKAVIIASDFVKPEYLLGIDVDAFVCTACPRIAVDDSGQFKKPVLNPAELGIVLDEKTLGECDFGFS